MTASRILRKISLLAESGELVQFDAASEYVFAELFDVRTALDGDELRARTGYRLSTLVLDVDAIERIAAWSASGERVTAFGEGESSHVVWADPVVPSLSAPEEGEPQMLWGRRLGLSSARSSSPIGEGPNLLSPYGWARRGSVPGIYAPGGDNPGHLFAELTSGIGFITVEEGGSAELEARVLAPVAGRTVTATVDGRGGTIDSAIDQGNPSAGDRYWVGVRFYDESGAVLTQQRTYVDAPATKVSASAVAPAGTREVAWFTEFENNGQGDVEALIGQPRLVLA